MVPFQGPKRNGFGALGSGFGVYFSMRCITISHIPFILLTYFNVFIGCKDNNFLFSSLSTSFIQVNSFSRLNYFTTNFSLTIGFKYKSSSLSETFVVLFGISNLPSARVGVIYICYKCLFYYKWLLS